MKAQRGGGKNIEKNFVETFWKFKISLKQGTVKNCRCSQYLYKLEHFSEKRIFRLFLQSKTAKKVSIIWSLAGCGERTTNWESFYLVKEECYWQQQRRGHVFLWRDLSHQIRVQIEGQTELEARPVSQYDLSSAPQTPLGSSSIVVPGPAWPGSIIHNVVLGNITTLYQFASLRFSTGETERVREITQKI